MGQDAREEMRPARAALVVSLATLGCLLPFVNKAFHIDDTLFLLVGQQVRQHPLDFYGFEVNWYKTAMPMAYVTKNPPLASYYAAAASLALGWSEVGLHLAFLVPALGVSWGTYRLAQRYCGRPVLASLVAIFTPAFLVSSTSIMCDTMMLCFWVWAVEWWERGLDGRGAPAFVASALLIGLGFLTKYFAISLVPLLAVYTLFRRRRLDWSLLALVIPIVLALAYGMLTAKLYGKDLVRDAMAYAQDVQWRASFFASPLAKTTIGLTFAGGCIAAPAFFFPILWPRRVWFLALLMMLVIGWALFLAGRLGPSVLKPDPEKPELIDYVRWESIAQASVLAAAGVHLLGLAAWDLWSRRDSTSVLLALWLGGAFVFTAFVNWTVNARSILPAAPVAGILVARRLDQLGWFRSGLRDWRLLAPLGGAAALALAVANADYQFAGAARTAAKSLADRYATPGRTLWYEGHWGFQHYMDERGARFLDIKRTDCRPGDVVVIPLNNCEQFGVPDDRSKALPEYRIRTSTWIATMHQTRLAGFYANGVGPLPFSFGPVPPDRYLLYEVTKPIRGQLKFVPGEARKFDATP